MSRSTLFFTMATLASLTWVLAGCSKSSDRANAENVANGITQTMAASVPATSKACKLFSRDDISAALGKPVDDGHDWSAGCEWKAGDQAVQVVIARAEDWEPLAKDSGGESLPGIGMQAFVGPWLGDSRAGARTDTSTVYVITPSRDLSVKLLRQAVQRLPVP